MGSSSFFLHMEKSRREKKDMNFKPNGFTFLENIYDAKSKRWQDI